MELELTPNGKTFVCIICQEIKTPDELADIFGAGKVCMDCWFGNGISEEDEEDLSDRR